MFNNEKESKKAGGFSISEGENETVIGATVKVEGDFSSEGNVLVQGVVNGSLKTTGDLRIEEGAKVKADVEAANAIVRGTIKGNVSVQSNLELGNSASIEGDITTKVLSIEPGAVLHGHCAVSANVKSDTEPTPVSKGTDSKKE